MKTLYEEDYVRVLKNEIVALKTEKENMRRRIEELEEFLRGAAKQFSGIAGNEKR